MKKVRMSDIGLEPMTSSLSSWRSNQTELIAQKKQKIKTHFKLTQNNILFIHINKKYCCRRIINIAKQIYFEWGIMGLGWGGLA